MNILATVTSTTTTVSRPLFDNLHKPEPPVKNWKILLKQSFTSCMPLLMTTSAFGLGITHDGSPQWCYLHCLCTVPDSSGKCSLKCRRRAINIHCVSKICPTFDLL